MKKFLLSIICTLLPILASAQEPYAALSENNTVLTFYYDDQKATRGGMDVGPFTFDEENNSVNSGWYELTYNIKQVVFDESFANCTTITSTSYWFYDCWELTAITGLENLKTDNVTDMSSMFYGCWALTSLDLSNFNTAKVTNMNSMFSDCRSLRTIFVGNEWSAADAESDAMFNECFEIVGGAGTHYDINHIDKTYAHFDEGTTNPGYFTRSGDEPWTGPEPYAILSEDNTVLTFYYDDQKEARGGMYVGPFTRHRHVLTPLPGWEETRETIERVVFDESFADCTTITSTCSWFFHFENLTTITGLDYLKTDNVTDMSNMFYACYGLTSLDLSSFNTSNVTDMREMFHSCRALTSLDLSSFNTSNVTDMSYMFCNCNVLTSLDVSGFDTSNVTDMSLMFADLKEALSLDLSNFNTSNVTNMEEMFADSEALTSLDVSNFNTSNVTNMEDMFGACNALTSLDLSSFNTSNVTVMKEMFEKDSLLTTIYVGEGWTTENVSSKSNMFRGCTALVGGAGTKYDENHIDHTYAHIDGGSSNPGYFTAASSGDEPYWQELNYAIEYGDDVLSQAKESSSVDPWMVEELEMFLNEAHEMYKTHEADSEEVRNTTEELNRRIQEVEEAMKGGSEGGEASEEAWAELHDAVDRGDKLLTEAREAGTVEQWALEELENRTVEGSLMYEEHKAGEEEVRHATEELNHIIWEVEEMMHHDPQGEAYFQNYTAYVYGNATLDDAFAEVGRETAIQSIAAIVWDADSALTAEMLNGITNPNLLVYVTEASKAPAGVQNVVINGVAEEIILTDATGNNNFYCPQSFTARSISYSRDFSQTTEIEVCRGWETIALPFDVQSITHESHGTLIPFGGESSGYQFWLRQLSDNGLARATRIEANRPYLISMPNNSIYPSVYNQNGKVTFSASDVTVPETTPQSDSYAGVTLYATFQQVAQSSSIYALNVGEARGEYPEGSMFEQNYRDIRPFQAYTTHTAGTRGIITLESLGGNDNTTGIEEIRMNSELRDSKGPWYSLDGRRLDAEPTKKGIYVKDGRKFVIK